MGTIRAVAFDVDGTLYSEPLLYLRSIGFALRNRDTIRHFRTLRASLHDPHASPLTGDLRRWQVAAFAEAAQISAREAEQRIDGVIYDQWIERASRMPLLTGVGELLHMLKDNGIPLAILSDFPPQRKLSRWRIDDLFSVALNSEECNCLKPHRRPFELVAERLSLSPQSILYVGNNPRYDIAPADRLGFSTAYYRDPRQRHHHSAPLPADTFVFTRYKMLHRYLLQRLGN